MTYSILYLSPEGKIERGEYEANGASRAEEQVPGECRVIDICRVEPVDEKIAERVVPMR